MGKLSRETPPPREGEPMGACRGKHPLQEPATERTRQGDREEGGCSSQTSQQQGNGPETSGVIVTLQRPQQLSW